MTRRDPAGATISRLLVALVAGLALAADAAAMQAGRTAEGRAFASGGVSHEELMALHARRDAFNLWVVTAALRSGAYLAEAQVTIRDAKDRVVYDGRLDGPWLFIDLPLGRYRIDASYQGQSRRSTTTIHRGDHHQAFFYFDTSDEVGADHRPPFERNPYEGSKR